MPNIDLMIFAVLFLPQSTKVCSLTFMSAKSDGDMTHLMASTKILSNTQS